MSTIKIYSHKRKDPSGFKIYYSPKVKAKNFNKTEKKIGASLRSRFSCVRLCATPWTEAHRAPLSLGFSRQEHCSGLPFPSPMQESEK